MLSYDTLTYSEKAIARLAYYRVRDVPTSKQLTVALLAIALRTNHDIAAAILDETPRKLERFR